MYTMLRNASLGVLLSTQAPAFLIAFVTAELFFKWKSFALECLGFLALWFVLDAAFTTIRSMWLKRSHATSLPPQ
jgi:hypothetical protein